MAAAGKAVAVLGERVGPKKERMELAETSFYNDKLDMLLRRHLGALRREAVGNHSSRCSSRSSVFEGSGGSHTPDLRARRSLWLKLRLADRAFAAGFWEVEGVIGHAWITLCG